MHIVVDQPPPLKQLLLKEAPNSLFFESVRKQILEKTYPRQALASILMQYNRFLGNDALALSQIERLNERTQVCVVTGQQLGVMGGPAYTILKGISCLLTAKAHDAVPIFWLATEDHDVAEIDHTYLLDPYGTLHGFHLSLPKDGRFVEDLVMNSKNRAVVEAFIKTAGIDPSLFPIHESYAHTMAAMMVRLFAGTGMVFLEPKLLRPLAVSSGSFFQREIEEGPLFQNLLEQEGEETNLFIKSQEGYRHKIYREGSHFRSGTKLYDQQTLLALIRDYPERFSCNVFARPVLQSLLLPTLAYVAGPSESQYYGKLEKYHAAHGVPMPALVLRHSATFLLPHAQEILETCKLDPAKKIPAKWTKVLPSLSAGLNELAGMWEQNGFEQVGDAMPRTVLERMVRQSMHTLQKRVIQGRLRKQSIPPYGLHLLRNLITPHNKLQERVLNWWTFQAGTSKNLVQECLQFPIQKPQEHLYCYLKA